MRSIHGLMYDLIGFDCPGCGVEIMGGPVELYDVDRGFFMFADWPKQWVTLFCPGCGRGTALRDIQGRPCNRLPVGRETDAAREKILKLETETWRSRPRD